MEKGFFRTAAGAKPIFGQVIPANPLLFLIVNVSTGGTYITCHKFTFCSQLRHFTRSANLSIVEPASRSQANQVVLPNNSMNKPDYPDVPHVIEKNLAKKYNI
jgi:hypothetical protein